MYTIRYTIYGQELEIHATNAKLAGSTMASLNTKGAINVRVEHKGSEAHELKGEIEAMNMADQLELIQRFKNYILKGTY